jgi:hypothetical protein
MKPVLTLADLAEYTRLPSEFLNSVGVSERRGAIWIEYRLGDGQLATRHRVRNSKVASEGSRWFAGEGKPELYGLWRLAEAKKAQFVVFVTGESDCWTLWHHGFPALGFPGPCAQMTKKLERINLEGVP